MSEVVFLADFEAGHVLPTFKIAQNLRNNGISVSYVGISDTQRFVSKAGFEARSVFEDIFPKGYVQKVKDNDQQLSYKDSQKHYLSIINGEIDGLMHELSPRVIISSCFVPLASLILHYKYGIPQIIYHPLFPGRIDDTEIETMSDFSFRMCVEDFLSLSSEIAESVLLFIQQYQQPGMTLTDLVSPLKKIDHVMLCPACFGAGSKYNRLNEFFIGPSIRIESEPAGFWEEHQSSLLKKIIFASMGSQTHSYPEAADKFFTLMLNSMLHPSMQEFHLIMVVGSDKNQQRYRTTQENISVVAWAPQTSILKNCRVAVIHGGLGSVKECIFFNVPMVVIPMGRDQQENAKRVERSQLGISIGIDKLTSRQLIEAIILVNRDVSIGDSLKKMSELFQYEDQLAREVNVVKRYL